MRDSSGGTLAAVAQSDPRVDDLRQQLKSLGYLDAGVDRFVLGGARHTRGPVGIALRTSIRVGLLGGTLLGPAAVIGVGARVPGLLSGTRDGLVLAVYFGVVFLAALTVATFAASLTATVVARRAGWRVGALARAAGWTLALGTLAYLTFWWQNANAGFGWQTPLSTASVLALAVLISFLIGHAVRIATLGTAAADAAPGAPLPPGHRASWLVTALGGLLAFAGAALLLVVTTSADNSAPAAATPLTVVSRGLRVRVVAIDGIDPKLVDEREWLPQYVSGARVALEYESSADPARTWTTIATGEPPEVHGIHAIEGRRVPGIRGMLSPDTSATGRVLQQATDLVRLSRPSIATRNERRVMTFWEVAEAAGLRTAVVNWWATWPAVTQQGIVVSDRAVLRLDTGGTLDGEISPASVYTELLKHWPAIASDAQTRAERSFAAIADRRIATILVRSATLDAVAVAIDRSLADPNRDLDVVYLPGLDIAQHALLADDGGSGAPSALTARLAALRAYPTFLRNLIGTWLEPAEHQVTMIITGPGRVGANADGHVMLIAPRASNAAPAQGLELHDVRVPTVFDERSQTARAVDVAPTILNILGVPISRELPGHELPLIVPAANRYVTTYGRPVAASAPRTGRPLDQEAIDRLRSLGYIK